MPLFTMVVCIDQVRRYTCIDICNANNCSIPVPAVSLFVVKFYALFDLLHCSLRVVFVDVVTLVVFCIVIRA